MEAIAIILVIAIIVFVFGLYADSGSKTSSTYSIKNGQPAIQYYTVSKKNK